MRYERSRGDSFFRVGDTVMQSILPEMSYASWKVTSPSCARRRRWSMSPLWSEPFETKCPKSCRMLVPE